ncbi:3-oxoacyl-[acyl-carrier protein] reductase [Brachybacterium muris]|uniref:3-oxoacyl-ACP reductase n=1 Tax=Brachybacterium muris TaxID=219301 RepID=UPI00195AF704|nr:3-oxoacyl-ACP reductase [Brachybacterium muris]MBM7501585.1 3-oxoacyl-[acyl-carrier protein] reductase [Brachybacterium muris]MCT2296140.1 3-oxoacyl-ACP reductase [Brachybacterium muris]
MADAYTRFVRSTPGAMIAKRTGLPRPARLLRREDRPEPVLGPVVVLGDSAGADQVAQLLLSWGADVRRRFEELRRVGSVVVVLDEVDAPDQLGPVLLPLAGAMRTLAPGARVVAVSRPATGQDPGRDATRGGIEGFTRSLAHEMRSGGTANGILAADGVALDAPGVIGALRFLLSARSAFVTGQFLEVTTAAGTLTEDSAQPLAGRTALVTGAARGIGAAIARTLAADGAHLVVLDVPAAGTELSRLANELRAVPIQLDVTSDGAGERLVQFLREHSLTLDVLVLNAGITRDKLFANMTPDRWDPVIGVNITSQITLTNALIDAGDVLGAQPRVVSLASTSGIAGNRGQTNYATSKAGVMAFVDALSSRLAEQGGTANAVAPGFIETEMTARMPAINREVARRVNSLQQGGLPVDVAEAIGFLSSAEAGGIQGQTLRVCGQNIVGR